MSSEPDSVMTVAEVSHYLKISESSVYRLAKGGKLPARKVGGVWRFSREALKAWLARPMDATNSDTLE